MPHLDRLAYLVATRRRELGLSVSAAARNAKVARSTWISVEQGRRALADYLHQAVDRVLGWQTGSVLAVLNGGDPTIHTEPDGGDYYDPVTGQTYTDPDERQLWALPFAEHERRKLIHLLRLERMPDQDQRLA